MNEKQTLSELQRRSSQVDSVSSQLERQVSDLRSQAAQKDLEISRLRSNLEAKERIEPAVIYSSAMSQGWNQANTSTTSQISRLNQDLAESNRQIGTQDLLPSSTD